MLTLIRMIVKIACVLSFFLLLFCVTKKVIKFSARTHGFPLTQISLKNKKKILAFDFRPMKIKLTIRLLCAVMPDERQPHPLQLVRKLSITKNWPICWNQLYHYTRGQQIIQPSLLQH